MKFKGWTIPGPLPTKTNRTYPSEASENETLDALCGHFKLFQLKEGHRFSTDDLLVGWYGTTVCPTARKVLDLGSGIGTISTLCAWRLPGAQVVTIEAQEESVRLAKKSAVFNGIQNQIDIRQGDFRDDSSLKPEERFDLITGSPPYFPETTGILSDHPQKNACRFEMRGTISDYCARAGKHLDSGGVFVCIFPIDPPHQLGRVQSAADSAGLLIFRERPIVLKEGNSPLLSLFAMMQKDDLPVGYEKRAWKEPDLIIRTRTGEIHPEYASIKMSIGFPP